MTNTEIVDFREKLNALLLLKSSIELTVRAEKGKILEQELRKLVNGVTQSEPFSGLMSSIKDFDGRTDAMLARCQEAEKQYEDAVVVLPEINKQQRERHHAKIIANKGNVIDLDPVMDLTENDLWRLIFLPKAE